MRYKRLLAGFLSITCFVSVFAIRDVNFQAKAAILGKDVVRSTEIMSKSFGLNTDKEYIMSALNLQDPYMYLSTGIARDARFFSGNIKKVTFEEGTCNWIYGKDKGEGFKNFLRNLFPSSSGSILSSQGGVSNENSFTRDLKSVITPEFIAKIASISYKYRFDITYRERSKELLKLCERNSKVKFLEFERRYFIEIDNYLFRKKTIEKIKNLLEEKEENFKENILSKQELDRIKECNRPITDFLKDTISRKKPLDKACYKEIQGILEAENFENCITNEDVELFEGVINFLQGSFIDSDSFLNQNLIKDKKAMCTVSSLILNMFYAIENQEQKHEQDNFDKFLPEFIVEKMLMVYFIDNFQEESVEKFYKAASDLIISDAPKSVNEDKTKEIFAANTLINFTGFDKESLNPYKNPPKENRPAQRLRLVGNNECMVTRDSFQDCVETAIRHTLNLLVHSRGENWDLFNYDDNIRCVDTPFRLNKTNWINKKFNYWPLKSRLKLFYEYQNGNVDQDSLKYRSLWNYVIGCMNVPEGQVPYRLLYSGKDNNELDADILNFLKFIYNVAYVLQGELKLNPIQLEVAKINLDNLIRSLDGSDSVRYLVDEEIEKVENSIKEIYGLISCQNLKVTMKDRKALLENGKIIGFFDVQIGNKFSFLSAIKDKHAYIKFNIPKDKMNCEIDEIAKNCNSDLIRIFCFKSFGLENFPVIQTNFENFHSRNLPLNLRSSGSSFEEYFCKSDLLRNFHDNDDLSEEEIEHCCKSMIMYLASIDKVNFEFVEKETVKKKLIELYNENEIRRDMINSLLCDCYFSGIIDEDFIKKIIGMNKINEYVMKSWALINSKLKKICVPGCINNLIIENSAFFGSNIEEFEVPETVESVKISSRVFFECKDLKSVIIPNLSCNDDGACVSSWFEGCKNLKFVNFSNILDKKLVDNFLNGCENLEVVKIGGNLDSIGSNCFTNCENLKSVKLPNSVKILGELCFSYCENLELIELPDSLETLDERCFSCCKNLRSIIFSKTLKNINCFCFEGCDTLEELELPNSLENIGICCFAYCKNLKRIKPMFKNGANIKNIGKDCFVGCENITEICISNSENLKLSTEFSECFIGRSVFGSCDIYFLNKPLFNENLPSFDEDLPLCFHTDKDWCCHFKKVFEERDGIGPYKFEFLYWKRLQTA